MANAGAWEQGWATGQGVAQHQRDRKEMLSDEQRLDQHGVLSKTRDNIQTQLSTFLDEKGNVKPEFKDQYDKATAALSQNQYEINQLWDPIQAPGALQRNWHNLIGKFAPKDKTPSSITTQTPAMTLPVSPSPLTVPEAPAYQQTTPRLPSQGGSVTTTVPGVPAMTSPGMASAPKGATPTMAVANPKGLVQAGNIPIWNRPSVLNDDGTHSSELSVSMKDDKGNEVLIPLIVDGKFLTPNGKMPAGDIPHNAQEWEKASPEWKALKMRAWQHYEQTGQHLGKFGGDNAEDDVDAYAQVLHNRGSGASGVNVPAGPPVTVTRAPAGPYQSPGEVKQIAAARQKAQQEAGLLAAGAGLSPEQEAVSKAKAGSAARYANLQADMGAWDKDNPNAPKDDRNAQYNQLYQKWFGTTGKGSWKMVGGTITDPTDPNKKVHVSYSFNSNTNQYANADGTPVRPDLISTFTPDPTTASANEQDFEKAVEDGYTGSRAQFRAEQAAKGRGDIAGIKFDPNSGQVIDSATGKRYSRNDTNLPPEVAKLFSSQQETAAEKQQKAIALVYARGQAMGASRYVMVAHPDGTVTYMSAGDASKSDAQSPAGIAFKTDAAMQRNLLGGGKIGQSILAYKTAAAHLDMLQQAADALNNGDVQFSNRTANVFNTAIGEPAPTNFDAIKAAVTGEIAKTFSTSVTLDDKAAILETISNAQSPAQIYGAISTYRGLMLSKANAAEAMGTAASQGLADSFTGGKSSNTQKNKGKNVSIAAAMQMQKYKGKSKQEVSDAITAQGYTPVP